MKDFYKYIENLDLSAAVLDARHREQAAVNSTNWHKISSLEQEVADLKRKLSQVESTQRTTAQKSLSSRIYARMRRVLRTKSRLFANDGNSSNDPGKVSGVSVVIATYREVDTLSHAIESVLNQNIAHPLEVIVVVNGGNKAWYEKIRSSYSRDSRVIIELIQASGYSAALNYGIQLARYSHLSFLDDDDYFSDGFLASLIVNTLPRSNVTCGFMCDSNGNRDYTYEALEKLAALGRKDPSLSGVFSTTCGKLINTDFMRSCTPFNESLSNTEDVIFWAENYSRISDDIGWTKNDDAFYIRRLVEDSLSRPVESKEFDFFVQDRLVVIGLLEEIIFRPADSVEHSEFVRELILAQTLHIKRYYDRSSEGIRQRIAEAVRQYPGVLINRGSFSNTAAIAFCHNFSPSVDPSAFVATKRLAEIDAYEQTIHKWTVMSKNMSGVRQTDWSWNKYFTIFACENLVRFSGRTSLLPQYQLDYALRAYWGTREIDAVTIYSRSMFPGSHLAAYLYKRDHPNTKWYAEFSDPLAVNSQGEQRDDVDPLDSNNEDKYARFYSACEELPYRFADVVIFTNRVQRDYMMSYLSDKELVNEVLNKSLVWPHPVIDSKYARLSNKSYSLSEDRINIGYFGSFYKTRSLDDVLAFASNPNICVHLFIPNPDDMASFANTNLMVNHQVSYFDFLRIASKMDYLFVADMQPIGSLTPWLPSKVADYQAIGVPIIAKCNEGSPLSLIESKYITKVTAITEDLLSNLHKRIDA